MFGRVIDPLDPRLRDPYPRRGWTVDSSVFFLATRTMPDNILNTADYYLSVVERAARAAARRGIKPPAMPRDRPDLIEEIAAAVETLSPRRDVQSFLSLLSGRRVAAMRAAYVMYDCAARATTRPRPDDESLMCRIPDMIYNEVTRSPHASNIVSLAMFKLASKFWEFYQEYYKKERELASRELARIQFTLPEPSSESLEYLDAAAEALKVLFKSAIRIFTTVDENGNLLDELYAVHALGLAMGFAGREPCRLHGGGWTIADASIIYAALVTGTKVATGDAEVAKAAYALGIPVMYAYGRPRLPPRLPFTQRQPLVATVYSPCTGKNYKVTINWHALSTPRIYVAEVKKET